ncbi:hypothetical protein AX16_005123 [Volvariella volvacea WC 439]|nr:hypothetical protein AX16_005123 [Volvariella volvacea WC 439]
MSESIHPLTTTASDLDQEAQMPLSRHNSLAPIGSLFPEVLRHIFLLLADEVDFVQRFYVPQVSHTCGHWRSIAINTPNLWNQLQIPSFITESRLLWAQECIRRTKSAPILSVRSVNDGSNSNFAELMHQMLPDFRLIRLLDISLWPDDAAFDFVKALLQPYSEASSPNIRHLSIHSTRRVQRIPFKLFNDSMPNLQSLFLVGWTPYDWSALSFFTSLKDITIHLSPPTLATLNTLATLPLLEKLSIIVPSSSEVSVSEPPSHTSIHFKALQKLKIEGTRMTAAHYLFKSIYLPLCTRINISCAAGSEQDYLDLLSLLIRLMTTGSPPITSIPIHCLYLDGDVLIAQPWDDHTNLSVAGNHTCATTTCMGYLTYHPTIYLYLSTDPDFFDTSIVRPLLQVLDLRHLHTVTWSGDSGDGLKLDASFFASMKELRVAEAIIYDVQDLDGLLPPIEHVATQGNSDSNTEDSEGKTNLSTISTVKQAD